MENIISCSMSKLELEILIEQRAEKAIHKVLSEKGMSDNIQLKTTLTKRQPENL